MARGRGALIVSLAIGSLVLGSCRALAGPERRGRDRVDRAVSEKIKAFTTDPSFLTPWVDHLPVSRTVPAPQEFLGYLVGTPNRLTPPGRISDYFRALARSSRRVRVLSLGTSHGGREMIVAAISDAANLVRLDDIKSAHRRIGDPARTSEPEARRLAETTPPIYWLTAGLHSPETGPPEMTMELAYRLAVSEQDHIREIRRNVVTLITPVLEMDGRARMVDWYERYLTKVVDLENSPPRMAPYWGDYTAHDNNRDGLQLSQPLTRNFVGGFHDFMPVGTLDLHESVPLLYVSTGTGPYNHAIDPITVTEWQWISSYEVSQCTKLGLRGVWTWGFYSGWYPGYLVWVANNHNSVGRFYETFGNGHPGTFERELHDSKFAKRRTMSRQWYRAWPPEARLRWSLRNNTNYMQTAAIASLQLYARNGSTLLYNMWKKNANAIARGRSHKPHAFIIPAEQRDLGALHRLLWLLDGHRIEVRRIDASSSFGGARASVTARAGDYLVRLDQRYGGFARTLLMPQPFPKTAAHTPYDDVAWSLDYMLGVDVHPVNDPAVLKTPSSPLSSVPALAGSADAGSRWIVDHRAQRGLARLAWQLGERGALRALTEPWRGHPAGSLLIEGIDRATVDRAARTARLRAIAVDHAPPKRSTRGIKLPRIALFHTWVYTQDSGWARYALEQLGIPYTLINKDQLRAGKLRDRFDVIVVPSQGSLPLARLIHGIDTRWGPMPYTRTAAFPSHGVIDSSEDITGGMGFSGLANLQAFAEQGGALVALGSGGRLIVDGGIARNVRSRSGDDTPGSHVTTRILRPEHPLAWGYPDTSHVFRGNLPIYDVPDYWRGMAIMQFGTKTWRAARREADRKADIPTGPGEEPAPASGAASDPGATEPSKAPGKPPLVLSGIVKKPAALSRRPALIDAPVGRGRAIVFSWNPLHRYQNHHDFGFFENALLFWDRRPEIPSRDEMRRREPTGTRTGSVAVGHVAK